MSDKDPSRRDPSLVKTLVLEYSSIAYQNALSFSYIMVNMGRPREYSCRVPKSLHAIVIQSERRAPLTSGRPVKSVDGPNAKATSVLTPVVEAA